MQMKGIHKGLVASILVTVLAFSASCSQNEIDYPDRAIPAEISADPSQIKQGETLFKSKCASCHGKPSEGRSERAAFFNPPAPDFTESHYQDIDPAYIYWRIETGKNVQPYRSRGSVMPAWGPHLNEKQIWQIVAYLRSRAH